MKRAPAAELLDTDAGTSAEVADSLSDLHRVNRWFGGVATTKAMVEQVAAATRRSSFSLLEVAAGSGYVPEVIRQQLDTVQLDVTLLDQARSHLDSGSRAVVGNALALPFRDASFDMVSCGLFAHHLDPREVVQFVNEGLRVCCVAVLINDLIRHPVHLAMVYAGYPLYRSRLTRHDAVVSVRQAYTIEEMKYMLAQTRAARVEIDRHYLFRMGAIAWKSDLSN